MRTRRQFRPVFEFLPGRIAPSCVVGRDRPDGFLVDPGDTTTIVDPMDGSSDSLDRSVIGRSSDRDRLVGDHGFLGYVSLLNVATGSVPASPVDSVCSRMSSPLDL